MRESIVLRLYTIQSDSWFRAMAISGIWQTSCKNQLWVGNQICRILWTPSTIESHDSMRQNSRCLGLNILRECHKSVISTVQNDIDVEKFPTCSHRFSKAHWLEKYYLLIPWHLLSPSHWYYNSLFFPQKSLLKGGHKPPMREFSHPLTRISKYGGEHRLKKINLFVQWIDA